MPLLAPETPPTESRLVVARRAPEAAALQFYGNVGEAFGGFGAAQFAAALDEVKESRAVTLYMSSEGGDFFEGIAIYSQIARFAETHGVTVVVDGIAASAASVIAMGAKRLVMAPAARLMIHEAAVARTEGRGTKAQHAKTMALIDGANETMASIYAKRSGLSVEQIRAFFAEGDTYLSAQQAVELGFADEIEGAGPAPKRRAAAFDEARVIAAARINAQIRREHRDAASRSPDPGQPGQPKAAVPTHNT